MKKLDAGMAYDFWDKGVNDRKLKAIAETQKLNAIDPGDEEAIEAACADCSALAAVIPGRDRDFAVITAATSM